MAQSVQAFVNTFKIKNYPNFYSITPFFSWGVLRYFTQTWWNNYFWCLLRRLPRPQDVGHLCLRYCKYFKPFYNLNYSARERAPWRRVTEKSHFSTLNVGLAGTGNWTQATCLTGSDSRRSDIHYTSQQHNTFGTKSYVESNGDPNAESHKRTCRRPS
jgi:hypothetical protein